MLWRAIYLATKLAVDLVKCCGSTSYCSFRIGNHTHLSAIRE